MLEECFEEKNNAWKYIKGEQWGRTISQQGILQLFVKTSQVEPHKTSQLLPNNWKMFPKNEAQGERFLETNTTSFLDQPFSICLNELQISQFINKAQNSLKGLW